MCSIKMSVLKLHFTKKIDKKTTYHSEINKVESSLSCS